MARAPILTCTYIAYGVLSVVQVSCYFATKSLDEYLYLQQLALMEITRVVNECGCKLAFPTTHVDVSVCYSGTRAAYAITRSS